MPGTGRAGIWGNKRRLKRLAGTKAQRALRPDSRVDIKGNVNKSEFETGKHYIRFSFWKYYYRHSRACLDVERQVRRHEPGATGDSRACQRAPGALFLFPESQNVYFYKHHPRLRIISTLDETTKCLQNYYVKWSMGSFREVSMYS